MKSMFAQRLIELRNENKFSQKELADKIDCTQSAVSRWEKGQRLPDAEKLVKLCAVLQVPADYMLGLTDAF